MVWYVVGWSVSARNCRLGGSGGCFITQERGKVTNTHQDIVKEAKSENNFVCHHFVDFSFVYYSSIMTSPEMTKKTFNFPPDKNLNLINYLD